MYIPLHPYKLYLFEFNIAIIPRFRQNRISLLAMFGCQINYIFVVCVAKSIIHIQISARNRSFSNYKLESTVLWRNVLETLSMLHDTMASVHICAN